MRQRKGQGHIDLEGSVFQRVQMSFELNPKVSNPFIFKIYSYSSDIPI